MKATLTIDSTKTIGVIEDTFYSSFIEHMGRAIYTGIYEPTHHTADRDGFREDVLSLIKPLSLSLIRYPGGNFVSGYNWRDGIGPKDKRPIRMDLAWEAIEPNQFGIDEFVSWCRKAGVEPMIAVNLGTGTPKDAAELVEYCNAPKGSTTLARLREENGSPEPYGIKYWCLGNEMDGPWQICAKTMEEYGRIAHETAKMIKLVSPEAKLVLCGSSYKGMPTFGRWERTVLRECWDYVDYLSLHSYYRNDQGDYESFLASSEEMDEFIDIVKGICEEIQKEKKSEKKMALSFDEWNVWYHYQKEGRSCPKWTTPRAIEEEDYDADDSLVVFSLLTSLLNHADIVKIQCMAQLVNVISPITTEPEGEAFVRSIYWPLLYVSQFGRGTVLSCDKVAPTYDAATRKGVSVLASSAVLKNDNRTLVLLLENKSQKDALDITFESPFRRLKKTITFRRKDKSFRPIEEDRDDAIEGIRMEPAEWKILVLEA